MAAAEWRTMQSWYAKLSWTTALFLAGGGLLMAADGAEPAPAFWQWAPTPPMGWNSWDRFATTVTEAQTKAQADFMAKQLARHGWQYITVDIQW